MVVAMGYLCELGAGQSVYREHLQQQTLVTIVSSSPGQQQQSSSGMQTGDWTAPPEVFRSSSGFVVKLCTAQGDRFVHIQGSRLSTLNEIPALAEAQPLHMQQVAHLPVASMPPMQPLPPLQPMAPMQPMTMGNMQMDRETMSMQMGDLHMSLNPIERAKPHPSQTHTLDVAEAADGQRHFCSQCGVAIKSSDRFCASCGHRLN